MKSRSREHGLTLVELVIAMAVLAIAIMALVSSISAGGQIQQQTRERQIAYNAARDVIEKMRVYANAEIYSRYNSTTADDSNYSGGFPTHPGNTFHVPGLAMPSTLVSNNGTGWTLPTAWSVEHSGNKWVENNVVDSITGKVITDIYGVPLGNDGVGEIIFPEVGGKLSEQYVDADMGMPPDPVTKLPVGKDLNRNGSAADTDVGGNYKILPVKVRVTWKSVNGKFSQIEVNTFMTDK